MLTTKPLPAALVSAFPHMELRTTVRLHPRCGRTALWEGKLGGDSAWPDDEFWLRCAQHGEALEGLLPVSGGEVPEVRRPGGCDIFQLLRCRKDHAGTGANARPWLPTDRYGPHRMPGHAPRRGEPPMLLRRGPRGRRVGGFPLWIQGAPYPSCDRRPRMEHLLTLASSGFDGGSWLRWLPAEERDVWTGPTRARLEVQWAADLMIGDDGTALSQCS